MEAVNELSAHTPRSLQCPCHETLREDLDETARGPVAENAGFGALCGVYSAKENIEDPAEVPVVIIVLHPALQVLVQRHDVKMVLKNAGSPA